MSSADSSPTLNNFGAGSSTPPPKGLALMCCPVPLQASGDGDDAIMDMSACNPHRTSHSALWNEKVTGEKPLVGNYLNVFIKMGTHLPESTTFPDWDPGLCKESKECICRSAS
ncbi:hypothetical protein STEG23_033419 [Scotinomys teguina]